MRIFTVQTELLFGNTCWVAPKALVLPSHQGSRLKQQVMHSVSDTSSVLETEFKKLCKNKGFLLSGGKSFHL